MRVMLRFDDKMSGCEIKVSDSLGSRDYLISPSENEILPQEIEIYAFDDEFDLELTPTFPDFTNEIRDFKAESIKDRLALGAVKLVTSSFDKIALRVLCKYHICGVKEGDRLDITTQHYIIGSLMQADLLGLFPAPLFFCEVSQFTKRFEPTAASPINRKQFLKMLKRLALIDVSTLGIFTVVSYPLQVIRAKYLSSRRKIYKTLLKFHNMSDAQRQKILERQEKL